MVFYGIFVADIYHSIISNHNASLPLTASRKSDEFQSFYKHQS